MNQANQYLFTQKHLIDAANCIIREARFARSTYNAEEPDFDAQDLIDRLFGNGHGKGVELAILPTHYQTVVIRVDGNIAIILYKVKDPDEPELPAVTVGMYINDDGDLDGDPFESAHRLVDFMNHMANPNEFNIGLATACLLALESTQRYQNRVCAVLQNTAQVLTGRMTC